MASAPAPAHEDIQKQIDDLDRRIEADPGEADLYLRRAELRRVHRDWDAARADYRKAKRLDPALDIVDLCLGRLYLEEGRAKKAEAEIDRYLARRPTVAEGYLVRARARAALGRRQEAVDDYRRSLSLPAPRPPSPDTYIELARLLEDSGEGGPAAALRAIDEGIATLGPIVTLQMPAIELEISLGRFEDALRRVEIIAAQAGRKEIWFLKRAAILRRAGRDGDAARAYEEALRAIADLPADRRATRATTDALTEACAGLTAIAGAPRARAAGCS
jgi:predicted Zn-dependent protease